MSAFTQDRLPMGNSSHRASAKESIWRLAALALGHPTPEFHAAIITGEFHDAFGTAWSSVTGRHWPRAGSSSGFKPFEAGFITAFLHGRNGKPAASLLAGDHEAILAGLTRPVFMLNLSAFYKHFGLQAATKDEGRRDEPDHLATMQEFMAVLCHFEARALSRGRDASPYRRAQRDFLCRYLRPALDAVAGSLRRNPVQSLDPTLQQLVQDMGEWASAQIIELEARVGPFRDPDTPRSVGAAGPQTTSATQDLWG